MVGLGKGGGRQGRGHRYVSLGGKGESTTACAGGGPTCPHTPAAAACPRAPFGLGLSGGGGPFPSPPPCRVEFKASAWL